MTTPPTDPTGFPPPSGSPQPQGPATPTTSRKGCAGWAVTGLGVLLLLVILAQVASGQARTGTGAYGAGLVIGRLLMLAVAVWLIFAGARLRRGPR